MHRLFKEVLEKRIVVAIFFVLSFFISLSLGSKAYAKNALSDLNVQFETVVKSKSKTFVCPIPEVNNNLTPNQTYYGDLIGPQADKYIGTRLYLLSPRKEVVGCGVIEKLADNTVGYKYTRALGTVLPEWDSEYTFYGMNPGEEVTFLVGNRVVQTSVSPVIWYPDFSYTKIDLLLLRN